LFPPVLSHRTLHPETGPVGAVPLLYSISIKYHAWLMRKTFNRALKRIYYKDEKTPNYKHEIAVLASPTQAFTPLEFALLTYISQLDRAV
jgi:hypothetical protein